MPWLAPCSGVLPMWYTIDGVALVAFIEKPWAPKPQVHLPIQRLVLGSFHRDHAVRASTCLHGTRLTRGSGSLSLGTYDAPTSCMPSKLVIMALLFTEPGKIFHPCQGLFYLATMEWSGLLPILLKLSCSKAATNTHLSSIVGRKATGPQLQIFSAVIGMPLSHCFPAGVS